MKYAVIKTGGKQYKVQEGDIIEIDRLANLKDENVTFEEVFLVVTDGVVKIGNPTVLGVKVTAKLLENLRGEKIRVSKFKSKVRYRVTTGFRAELSKIQIEKIGGAAEKTTVKKEVKARVAKKKLN